MNKLPIDIHDELTHMLTQTPNRSPSLNTEQELRLRMAWAVLILGMAQHDVAALFSTNGGRVAEAVTAMREALAKWS